MKKVYFIAALCVMFAACSAFGDELSDLIRNAEAGDPQSQLALGWRYLDGNGVKQDKKRGFQWVEKAANQGYAPAENSLGYLYDHGIGTTVNYKKAFELFTSAGEKGNVTAQNNLGAAYSNGHYVQRNYTKAFYWFKKAAAQDSTIAQRNLGRLYEYGGRGFSKNTAEAVKWYQLAAAKGDEESKKALKRLGAPVPETVKKETQQAKRPVNPPASGNDINALIDRARRGEVDAVFQIGLRYADGNGVPQDYRKAAEWYEIAASRGHAQAQNNLGVLYETGKGVSQDYRKAREWYEKAAAQNYGWAFHNLGWMYQQGQGVNVDYKKAFEYYTKGAGQGIARSFNQLGWFYEQGLWVKTDYKQAFNWYTRAAEKGDRYGLNNLGRMYEDGIGTSRDLRKAMDYYRQAAAKGNTKAKEALARLESQQKPSAPAVAKTTPKTQPKPVQPAPPAPAQNNDRPVFTNNSRTKPRLAVLDFEDKSEERKANPDTIRTSMVTALHKTDIFNLQERERLDDLRDEITLGQSGLMDASTAAKIGKLRGAQYVMMGAITLCYYSEKASGFIFPVLGFETRAKTAYVVIDIRIVEVETGDIVYTESKIGEASNKTKKNIGKSEKMIGGLLDMATRNAVDKHVSAIRVLGFHS